MVRSRALATSRRYKRGAIRPSPAASVLWLGYSRCSARPGEPARETTCSPARRTLNGNSARRIRMTIMNTRLGVGFDAYGGARRDHEAWKRSIGTKQVPARLAMLPEGESRWQRLGISAVAQVLIVAILLAIPLFFPDRLKTALNMQIVPLSNPVTEIPVAPKPEPPKAKVTPTPKPVVIEEPKLNPKQPHIFTTPKVVQPKIEHVDAKAPDIV